MRIFKIWLIRIVLFFVFFFMLNGLFVFILENYSDVHTKMLKSYADEDSIDLCILGSSVAYCSINPYELDSFLNRKSFDFATPSQYIEETHEFLKMAISTNKIETVCIGCTYDMLKNNSLNAAMAVKRISTKLLPLHQQIYETVAFLMNKKQYGTTTSVSYLFPWTYNHIPISPSSIKKNIKEKITDNSYHEKLKYVGKGYWASDIEVDFNKVENLTKVFATGAFSQDVFIEIDKICTLCKENNIDFFVFAPPYTVYDVLAWKDEYVEKMMQLKSFFAERNVEYYDFNFIKPEIFKSEEQYFIDFQHMNSAGADAFTSAFAKFLQMRAAGEDMEQYFYTPEEYFASIDYISAVNLSVVQKEDTLNFDAEAYCGSLVVPEYQFLIKEAGETSFSVIKDYGKESNLSFAPLRSGSYDVRVNARIEGTDTEFDRYNKKTIVFREKRGKR